MLISQILITCCSLSGLIIVSLQDTHSLLPLWCLHLQDWSALPSDPIWNCPNKKGGFCHALNSSFFKKDAGGNIWVEWARKALFMSKTCSVILADDVIASCLPCVKIPWKFCWIHFMKEERFSPALQMEKQRQLNAEFDLLIYSVGFIFQVEEFVFTHRIL